MIQSSAIDRRSSPRIETNLSIRLFPDNIKGNILNLSETGVCFDSERPILSKDVLLSMDLSPFKSKQSTEISAKVVWNKPSDRDIFHFGAQFSLLEKEHVSTIRDFIFDGYAKEASARIKEEELKIKVQDFFYKDVRQYHEELSALALEIANEKTGSEEIEKRVITLTNRLLMDGDTLEKTVANKTYMKKIKQAFRELTGCWVYKSAIAKMAYEKPRGYPGDYRLFEIIYDNKPLSEGIGFYCDIHFLNNTYTMAIRTRKNKMKNILQDFIENNSSSCIRLLNIACGPCREIRELLSDPLLSSKKKLVFTGIDNDEDALEFSRASLENLPPNIEVRFLKENVLNLFRDNSYYNILGKQDIIYILGLTEYLTDRIFKRLIHFLSQLLNDKGRLVITYKDKDILFPSLFPDWFCDWTFVKRTKEDLIKVATDLGSDKFSLKIEREGTGTIFFLTLTKK